ncbi:uncharacterized protein EHS24_005943 [Apiotrichum porosum]|uniref:NADH dehydrogenase (Ubiquinone) 1 alpha subcomplex 6 n=1 Tax=Apiotrichum porosum TaxID=105984 RepID=A0A427Y028_9TREE|nr:uncharacterized protein EHS24_005943 [Apiotrichum porosum]RSH84422.1 hypothetical protein EHS24_005943 [Apiotrichum porosum]
MTTIPSRLAKSVHIAKSMEEARRLTIDAYRAWYRSAPEICALYALNVSPSAIRLKIRQDFEKHRDIQDINVINLLLHKNQQEYQETMNCWKQEPNIMHWFKPLDDPAPPATFMEKFYAGRDDPKTVASF